MDKDTILLVGLGAVAVYLLTRQAAPQQQQPIIIQQPAQQQSSGGGIVSNILGGVGQAIDGIIEAVK